MKSMCPKRGSDFAGCVRYNLSHWRGIGGNMLSENPNELGAEFDSIAELRREIDKPCWHSALALTDGEELTDDQWREVAAKHLQNIGIDPENHQYALFRHDDKGREECHLVVNRVGYDGKVWNGEWDLKHSINSTQIIEREYGLKQTQGMKKERGTITQTYDEKKKMERLGIVEHPKQTLQAKIDISIRESDGSKDDFTKRLEAKGVKVHWNESKTTGRISGCNFELKDCPPEFSNFYKGSQLGNAYSWTNKIGLQKRLENHAREVAKLSPEERESEALKRNPAKLAEIVQEPARDYVAAWKTSQGKGAQDGLTLATRRLQNVTDALSKRVGKALVEKAIVSVLGPEAAAALKVLSWAIEQAQKRGYER